MRFAPLICVTLLLALGAGLWAAAAPQAWGIGRDASVIQALVYAELALAPLLLPVRAGRGRHELAFNLGLCLACWAACSAVVLLFGFASTTHMGLSSRWLSLCAWLFAGGVLAVSAAWSSHGPGAVRPLVLAAMALPVLFHYLSLEYAGAEQGGLAQVSPHWLLLRGHQGPAWWLGGAGAAAWLAAGGLCLLRRRPA